MLSLLFLQNAKPNYANVKSKAITSIGSTNRQSYPKKFNNTNNRNNNANKNKISAATTTRTTTTDNTNKMQRRSAIMDQSPPIVDTSRQANGSSRWASMFGLNERNKSEEKKSKELLAGVEALRKTSKMATKTAEAQRKGADALAKWAERTNNNAMADVVGWSSQLLRMFADEQCKFAKDYEHFLTQISKVADVEKQVRAHEQRLEYLHSKEAELRKQLAKKDCHEVRHKLDRASEERKMEQLELANARADAELWKMKWLREGLMGMADSHRNLAQATKQIFDCQRELAECLPVNLDQDVRRMRYEGVPRTRESVGKLRQSLASNEIPMPTNAPSSVERRQQHRSDPHQTTTPLDNSGHTQLTVVEMVGGRQNAARHGRRRPANRQQQPLIQRQPNPFGTPPPPYTPTAPPTAPPYELLSDSARGTPNAVRLHPNRHSTGATMLSGNPHQNPPTGSSTVAAGNSHHNRIYPRLSPIPFELTSNGGRA